MSIKIDNLEYHIQRVLPQVYEDSLSYSELLGKVIAKLNETIGEVNKYFSEDIEVHIEAILQKWYDDGTLAQIINETIFGDLNDNLRERGFNVLHHPTIVVKADKVTDNTNAIETILAELTPPALLFIPPGVKWIYPNLNHPDNIQIIDHSTYDWRNDNWGAQLKEIVKTDSPGTKNANEKLLLAPYHPAYIVDNVGDGLGERRASFIFRQGGTSHWRVGKGIYNEDDHFVIAEFPFGTTRMGIRKETGEVGFGAIPLAGTQYFFNNPNAGTSMNIRKQTDVGTTISELFYQGTTLQKRVQHKPDGSTVNVSDTGSTNKTVEIDGTEFGTKRKVIIGATNNTLGAGNSEVIYTNEGYSGGINFTLPTAVKGLVYEFYVIAPVSLNVNVKPADNFRGLSVGIGKTNNVIGNYLKVVCVQNGVWESEEKGTWTV